MNYSQENHPPISTLVFKTMLCDTTQSESVQLEEWASRSIDNRKWLDQFNDPAWVLGRIEEMQSVNVAECKAEFIRRLKKAE